jgi:hypothetical protein
MTEPPQAAHEPARPAETRGNAAAVWAVLVLAGILLFLTSSAIWVDRVALNTGVFVDASAELLDDEAIRKAVATRAVDELFDNVDIEAEIEDRLPENLEVFSGPATAGLRQASYPVVERALEQPALQRLWALSLEQSHRTLVAVLRDEVPVFSTRGGVVTLELEQIVLSAADRAGLRSQVEGKLPRNVGSIEIVRSDELDAAQDAVRILETLAWVLPLLTLGAFVLAVWIARDRRRAVRRLGIVVVVTALVGLVATRIAGTYLVDSLTTTRDIRTASLNAWMVVTELLRMMFRWLGVAGALFVVASWLAGPGRRATASRRTLAPALHGRAWPYAVLGALLLILLLTSPVTDFVRLLVLAVALALGILWIELTRRQTLREFPDVAGFTLPEGTRERLAGWWETQRRAAGERREQLSRRRERAPSAPPAGAPDTTAQLAQLADLHARGELTDAEFAAAKARVLAGE